VLTNSDVVAIEADHWCVIECFFSTF